MQTSGTSALREIFRPWHVKVTAALVAIPTALQIYDVCCNQFGLPKLPSLWRMIMGLVPLLGWLLILQGVFLYALFEYVRRIAPSLGGEPVTNDDAGLRAEVSAFAQSVGEITEGYQRTLAEQTRLTETIEGLLNRIDTLTATTKPMVAAFDALQKLRVAQSLLRMIPKAPENPRDMLAKGYAPRNMMAAFDVAARELGDFDPKEGIEAAQDRIRQDVKYCLLQDGEEARFGTGENKQAWHLLKVREDAMRNRLTTYIRDRRQQAAPLLFKED